MAINANTLAELQSGVATFEKILNDVAKDVPPGTSAGNALAIANSLIPVLLQSAITAIELVEVQQGTAAQPVA